MFPVPSGDAAAMTMDIGVLLGLMVMARLLNPAHPLDRVVFGSTTAVFLLIYAAWRWHDTLPDLALTAESLWPWLFIAFEFVAIIYTLISIVILFRSIDRTAKADAAEAALAADLGVAIFHRSFQRWISGGEDYDACVHATLEDFARLSAASGLETRTTV